MGKKGTAAARAAERERVGAALVIGVHPLHHRVSPPACAPGHLGGAAVLGDVKEGERPLAGAGMRGRSQPGAGNPLASDPSAHSQLVTRTLIPSDEG